MERTLKDEFKVLISGLSTEICKEVLIEDLKDINQKLQDTSREYKSISNEYTKLSDAMKKKLVNVQELIFSLDSKAKAIEANGKMVNQGLTALSKDREDFYKEVFNTLDKNTKEYSLKIHAMNEEERAIYIREFGKQLGEVFQNNTRIMQKELNIEEINVLKNSIEQYANDVGRNLQVILNKEESFIASLSSAICEEAKLEELKSINLELRETSGNYKIVSDAYRYLSEHMSDELIKTQKLLESLEGNINIINDNNEKISEGLEIISEDREAFYQEMLIYVGNCLKEYSEKVHSINYEERTAFINELNKQLSLAITNNIYRVEKAFSPAALNNLNKNLEEYSYEIGRNLQDILVKEKEQQNLLLSVEEKIGMLEHRLDDMTKKIFSGIDGSNKHIYGKFAEVENKMSSNLGAVILIMAVLALLIIFK